MHGNYILIQFIHKAGLVSVGACVIIYIFFCFCCFSPKSTAMVIGVQSVHLTTLFPEQA